MMAPLIIELSATCNCTAMAAPADCPETVTKEVTFNAGNKEYFPDLGRKYVRFAGESVGGNDSDRGYFVGARVGSVVGCTDGLEEELKFDLNDGK